MSICPPDYTVLELEASGRLTPELVFAAPSTLAGLVWSPPFYR